MSLVDDRAADPTQAHCKSTIILFESFKEIEAPQGSFKVLFTVAARRVESTCKVA